MPPRAWTTARAWIAGLAVAAGAALSVDLIVQRAAATSRPPGVVRDFFNATEAFGNGFGVAMIVLAVVVLDVTRRVQVGRWFAASLGAGLVADVVKMTIGRTRPGATDLEGLLASGASGWDTFVGVLPLTSLGAAGQSFPSAHTATAFGLAVALAHTYPRAAKLVYTFAAGVALQRVCTSAHFPSDVLAGAAVGVAWGHACFAGGPITRWFDRIEAWWSNRFGWPLPADGAVVLPAPALVAEDESIRPAA